MALSLIDRLSSMDRTLLFDTKQVHDLIKKMASNLYGKIANQEKVALIGLLRRGAPIADLLNLELKQHLGVKNILRLDLDIKRYADDLSILYPKALLRVDEKMQPVNLSGYTVVLVDDVLFTGNSMLTVLEYITNKGVASVYIACLVNRHAQQVPIDCNITGAHLEVNPQSIIECNIPPYEASLKIVLASPMTLLV
jgi:pyrimidine operon attenuation protein/uracil phosphoribosyltransferase